MDKDLKLQNNKQISRLKKRMNGTKMRMKKSKRRFPTSTDELINEKSVVRSPAMNLNSQ
jgi:ElaB/YqjD/DUF883 family membrane-anchored ribosome-binding protein